jgi:hypothetical protein
MSNHNLKTTKLLSSSHQFDVYKDKESIFKISKAWSIEADVDFDKILDFIYKEIRLGRFLYILPYSYLKPIESVTINQNIASNKILSEDTIKAAIKVKEEAIYKVDGEIIPDFYNEDVSSFLKTIECTTTEQKNELSKYIYLTKSSFLRWARKIWESDPQTKFLRIPKFLNTPPQFWGNLWNNQPESYNNSDDGIKNGYSLYDAIFYWSDPHDISVLDDCYNQLSYNQNPQLTFLKIDKQPISKKVLVYNRKLDLIYDRFLSHIENDRLNATGFVSSLNKTEKIEYLTLLSMIKNGNIDFIKSSGESGNSKITGIKVFKSLNDDDKRWERIIEIVKEEVRQAYEGNKKKFFHTKSGNGYKKGDINKTNICESVFNTLPQDLRKGIKKATAIKKRLEEYERDKLIRVW